MSKSPKSKKAKLDFPSNLRELLGENSSEDEEDEEDLSDEYEFESISFTHQNEVNRQDLTSIDISETGNQTEGFYIGRDGTTKWSKSAEGVQKRNLIVPTLIPNSKGRAKEADTPIKCLDLLIDSKVLNIIVNSTNTYLETVMDNYERKRDVRPTNETEIKAFIGLLYLIGTLTNSRKLLTQLWDNSKGNGLESCYLTLSENRFRFLLRSLQFDNVHDRNNREEVDKFAPIRELYEVMVKNFQEYYIGSEYFTIGEQIISYRGNCPFKEYLSCNPTRFGLKNYALIDAKTAYTFNLEPYVGIQPDGPYDLSSSSYDIALRLIKPLKGSNRNISGDTFFSSIPLAKTFKEQDLTYIGPIRCNKPEIPKEFLPNYRRTCEKSSLFGFQSDCTLVSYFPKRNTSISLISTMPYDSNLINKKTGSRNLPGILTFYEETKIGINLLNQLCKRNSVTRPTTRWPMVVFYNLLNLAAINALCLYKCNQKNEEKVNHSTFLENIAWELIKPQIKIRSNLTTIPLELRRRAKVLLGEDDFVEVKLEQSECPVETRKGHKGRCGICGRARDRSTRKFCCKCQKWTCGEHLKTICANCFK